MFDAFSGNQNITSFFAIKLDKSRNMWYSKYMIRSIRLVVRTLAFQAENAGFKSLMLHQIPVSFNGRTESSELSD